MNQRPQDKPAVQLGEPAEQAQAERTPQPELRTHEEISLTAQELEKNISRLTPNVSFPSHQLAQNFDALNYASISLSSPQRNEPQTPLSEPVPPPYIDPYIDPSELREPYSDSFRGVNLDSLATESKVKLPAKSKSIEGISPVRSFPGPLSIIPPHKSPSARLQSAATSLKSESSAPFPNIQNFSDFISRETELARSADRSDSESKTTQLSPPEPFQQADSEIEDKESEDLFDNDEVFLARTGDIINVNSEDGFDHIDLACYAINCASISTNAIRIVDEKSGSFEIHFAGIDYAIFADGIKVRLN